MPLLWSGLFVWSPIGSIQLSSCGSKFSFLLAGIRKEWGLSRQSWWYIRFNYRLSYMAIFTLVRIQEESVGTLLRFITGEHFLFWSSDFFLRIKGQWLDIITSLGTSVWGSTCSLWLGRLHEISESSWRRLVEVWQSCHVDVAVDACFWEMPFVETFGTRMVIAER